MNNHRRRCKPIRYRPLLFILSLIFSLIFGLEPAGETWAKVSPLSEIIGVENLDSSRYPTNQALYVTMRDGVKIAIDIWLPKQLNPGEKIPTLMRMDRYWRSLGIMGYFPEFDLNYPEAQLANNAGYALVLVDARGTGSSFGTQIYPWSPDEIQDYGEIVDWIIAQPWSNGKVGSYGTSYAGNATEFLGRLNHPAVQAIAPRFNDFDPYSQLAFPGGIFNEWFVKRWSENNHRLDANDRDFVCLMEELEGAICDALKVVITGAKPVDADRDGTLQAEAIRDRTANLDVYKAAQTITYRNDPYGTTGITIQDFSPYRFQENISQSQVPIFSIASWLDAGTANGAFSRFLTYSNPQKVVIGAWNHGGTEDASPYQPADLSPDPPLYEQIEELLEFFDTYLKDDSSRPPITREIRYYTMVEDQWKTTPVWPPQGIVSQSWYFGEDNRLTQQQPTTETGTDDYAVNFEATTSTQNRWHTKAGGKDVIYNDRVREDEKLLTYTSEPLPEALEITGHPVITLYVSSTANDGAFYVYLEDIDPQGEVLYITEGQLRSLHRQISPEKPPYAVFGPYHSFERQDGQPQQPGEVMQLSFDLLPTSVLIQKGHRLRVAIAGHDADTFARYPAQGNATLTLHRNTLYPSHIDLPIMNPK